MLSITYVKEQLLSMMMWCGLAEFTQDCEEFQQDKSKLNKEVVPTQPW